MPFGRYTCWSNDKLCYMGGLISEGKGIWGRTPQPKDSIANCCKCCCHLTNRNEERFRLFPNYFGLIIIIILVVVDFVVVVNARCRFVYVQLSQYYQQNTTNILTNSALRRRTEYEKDSKYSNKIHCTMSQR